MPPGADRIDTMSAPPPDVTPQLASLDLCPDKPLLICDADEVLFEFMSTFVEHLDNRGCYYDWRTLSLTGNVRHRSDDRALRPSEVRALINGFFDAHTADIPSVDGAADALRRLNGQGIQIVVVSNLPLAQADVRRAALAEAAMAYPLIANVGLKGPTVRHLASQVDAPTAFVDDIPHHHDSVARHAQAVHRLHFTANPRLRELQGRASSAHYHPTSWRGLETQLATLLLA